MKYLTPIILFVLSVNIFADTASVRVEPREPLRGESFNLIFEISTNSSEEPFISFDPGEIEVERKEETNYSQTTTIINGKMTSEKKLTLSYIVNAKTAGIKRIKNISIDVNGKKIKLRDLKFKVTTTSLRNRDVFLLAEPTKTKVFKGEGLTINYYLYYKVPVTTVDFVSFPKLNGFVKRFHNPPLRRERVSYNGEIYDKALRYTARLYPTKEGLLKIDPLKLRVGIIERRNRPFGVLGMNLGGRQKSRNLSSQVAEIEVIALPTENMPPSFTGLVGTHDFNLTAQRSKYLVNEPIELKLVVSGPGLLENYEGPAIYQNKDLENFDVKAELKEEGFERARKSFEYTYLARSPLNISQREQKLYFFNPNTLQYEFQTINIPELVVGGGAVPAKSNEMGKKENDTFPGNEGDTLRKEREKQLTSMLPPLFDLNLKKTNYFLYFNVFSLIVILLLIGELTFKKMFNLCASEDKKLHFYNELKSGKLNYKNLYNFLDLSAYGWGALRKRIKSSTASKESIKYFSELLDKCGSSEYKRKEKIDLKLEISHLDEFLKASNKKNENSNPYF